jgi:hypothetical protein
MLGGARKILVLIKEAFHLIYFTEKIRKMEPGDSAAL